MKILLANWQDRRNPHAGGAEVHLFEIFSRLAARGHTVRLVCSGFAGAPAEEVVDGIAVERHGDRHSFAWRAGSALRRAASAFAPDVVVDDINKIPLDTPRHTDRPIYAIVPHLFGGTAFHELSWPMATVVWLAERTIPRIYRRAWFHAISDSTRDDLIARGIPPERIAVVYPGVDTGEFFPDPAVARNQPPTFVYVGRLKKYKGLAHLIEALAIVRGERPDVTVDIAGVGDDRGRLEALARAHGVADAVRFRGFVDHATRVDLLRRATANVFPSPKEGWGITIMEAAACGTPSLASDAPGLRDSVRNGVTGLLVPHGDVPALAQGMLRLAADRALVERLGRAAREWAMQLSWETAAATVEHHLTLLAAGQLSPDALRSEEVRPAIS